MAHLDSPGGMKLKGGAVVRGWRVRFVFLGGGGGSWKIGIGEEGNVFFFRKKMNMSCTLPETNIAPEN